MRVVANFIFFLIILSFFHICEAGDVVMIQREFPMLNGQQQLSADVYINQSYPKGTILAVARKIFVNAPDKKSKLAELEIPFCLVKVIYANNNISIARMVYLKEKEELPNIKYYAPMIGDNVIKADGDMLKGYKKEGAVSFGGNSSGDNITQSQDPKQKKKEEVFEIIL